MNLPKLFFAISLLLFGTIGLLAIMKRENQRQKIVTEETATHFQVIDQTKPEPMKQHEGSGEIIDIESLQSPQKALTKEGLKIASSMSEFDVDKKAITHPLQSNSSLDSAADGLSTTETSDSSLTSTSSHVVIEHDDDQGSLSALFEKPSRCPIVETIRYKSRVSWKPKKSAWLIDYSNYYKTPLDFIYRSIQRGSERAPVQAVEGMEFNVLRRDIDFHFYLIVSFASCKLRLYYILPQEKKAVFLKSYPICLGRKDAQKASGSLTPLGLYQLGLKVATYQPNVMGPYKGKRIEMIQVFGTRWMPFEREVDPQSCTEPAKGFGIHGTPIRRLPDGNIAEDASSIGKFESDGCIRLCKKDIEELFSVISMRKAYVEIVPEFSKSRFMKGEI